MAKGVNRMTILGNLGKDPEVKPTGNGKKRATLTIATTETWNNQEGERIEETEWHRVVVWGRKAEIAEQYLRKGREVFIEGKKKTRSWEDEQGQKQYIVEIIAHDMQLIGGRPPQTPDDVAAYHNQQPDDDYVPL